MTQRASPQIETVDLDLHPNEASDLLPLDNDRMLSARGWDQGFWTVLDEGAVEDCVALIGRTHGKGGEADTWEVVRPRFEVPRHGGKTEDAEACARHDGWVYLVGSHYGSKSGPLEGKRAFLARFREADFDGDVEADTPELQIALNKFRLHRAVNDALGALGPDLLSAAAAHKAFVKAKPKQAGKRAAARIEKTDVPINVEGAAFDDRGALLLGLRYPVTAEGHPIIVELAGIERVFEDRRAAPVARRVWVLDNVGTPDEPVGIRALHRRGRELHAIVGGLDAAGKGSALLDARPEAGIASCAHYRVKLSRPKDGGPVEAELIQTFDFGNVEGLAAGPGGRFYYVTDEDDRVHIRLMRHETKRRSRKRPASAEGMVGDGDRSRSGSGPGSSRSRRASGRRSRAGQSG